MLFNKIKDLKNRKIFKKREILNISLKFMYTNFLNKNKSPLKFQFLKEKYSYKASKTKIVRRCILNNRSKSLRPFNVSRIKLRELLQFGIIPGYKKSIW